MKRVVLIILPILFASCNGGGITSSAHQFNSSDSTEIVKVIFDSLHTEIYTQWFMEPTHKKMLCYEPPSFRPRLLIEINKNGEIMINGELNPKSISELVERFYTANLYENDVTNNSPMYSVLTRKQLITQIKELEEELETIRTVHKESQEMIEFKQSTINEWNKKLEVLNLISENRIREPHYMAGIEIKYPKNCDIYENTLDSILLGFYKIREIDSKLYFNESYAKIFWKATLNNDSIALKKIEAFKILHPVRVLDHGKSRYLPNVEPPPPPLSK